MPFFDFDFDSGALSTKPFRMFCAITIPLTIIVLLVWFLGVKSEWTKWLKKTLAARAIRSHPKSAERNRRVLLFDMLSDMRRYSMDHAQKLTRALLGSYSKVSIFDL